jgi:hypothetical protein
LLLPVIYLLPAVYQLEVKCCSLCWRVWRVAAGVVTWRLEGVEARCKHDDIEVWRPEESSLPEIVYGWSCKATARPPAETQVAVWKWQQGMEVEIVDGGC